MKITAFFKNRPLASVLFFFIAGSLISIKLSGTVKIYLSVSLFAFAAALTVLKVIIKRTKSVLAVICILSAALSLALSYVRIDKLESNLPEGKIGIKGEVIEVLNKSDLYTSIGVLTSVNGENVKIVASGFEAVDAEIGDEIIIITEILPFTDEEDGFNEKTYYRSKGYIAKAEITEDVFLTKAEVRGIRYKVSALREVLCERIMNNVGGDSGGLMCALLLGDYSYLGGDVSLSFRRAGISHMIAISGMHMSILCSLLSFLLYKICKNRYVSTFIIIGFIIFYTVLSGMGGSVLRSGIMYAIMLLAFIVGRRNDSPTALMISVALIYLFDACSVYSSGLLLSFLATLGILFINELYSRLNKRPTMWRKLLFSMLCTLGALMGTVAVSAFLFGNFSTAVLIANLVLAFPMQIFLYMSIAALLPLPAIICTAFAKTGDLIIRIADMMSHGEWTYISMNYTWVKIILAIFSVIIVIMLFLPTRRGAVIALCSLTVVALTSVYGVIYFQRFGTDNIYVYETKSSSFCVIESQSDTTVIDTTSQYASNGYELTSALDEDGFTDVDTLIISEYGNTTVKRLDRIFSNIKVYRICLPVPDGKNIESLEQIYEVCKKHSVELELYAADFSANNGKITVSPQLTQEDSSIYGYLVTVGRTKVFVAKHYELQNHIDSTAVLDADVIVLTTLMKNDGIAIISNLPPRVSALVYSQNWEHVIVINGDKPLTAHDSFFSLPKNE